MKHLARRVAGLSELADEYDGMMCDVWGVLHNGVAAWPEAVEALTRFRARGGRVVMITNAPRPREPVIGQLANLGVPDGVFDQVVTSGDVTRNLIGAMSKDVFHIGPLRDHGIFDGLGVNLVDMDDAGTVVCTGLRDDRTETPADYAGMLADLRERDLPFICANPDIVVEYGDRLLWCAGALARDYQALGGSTHIGGKPHGAIYEKAMEELSAAAGRDIEKERVLAIGDGLATDVAGATRFGVDVLYVSAGIHAGEYGEAREPDPERLATFLAQQCAYPRAWLPRLIW